MKEDFNHLMEVKNPAQDCSLLGIPLEKEKDFSEFSELMTSLKGRYFTPSLICQNLSAEIIATLRFLSHSVQKPNASLSICDPFAGDGRLVLSVLEQIYSNTDFGIRTANVDLWDLEFETKNMILNNFNELDSKFKTHTEVTFQEKNSFLIDATAQKKYDLVITNPPWAAVKPRKNKGKSHDSNKYAELTSTLKEFDTALSRNFPHSQPEHKFAGWGTNLSRVGCELSLNLVAENGIFAIVLPVSFLADEASTKLRKYLFSHFSLCSIDIYSAEAKLFEFADVGVTTLVGHKYSNKITKLEIKWQGLGVRAKKDSQNAELFNLEKKYAGKSLPINFGKCGIFLDKELSDNQNFKSLEESGIIWAGRELDETGIKEKLKESGEFEFAKGTNISSFSDLGVLPWINLDSRKVPQSLNQDRIAWRDVSRANQKRRMIATLIPKGILTGNSLNIAYVKKEPRTDFHFWLLAVMNSLVFEAQLRATLATDHVSLSAIRRIAMPDIWSANYNEIVHLSKESLKIGFMKPELEYAIANSYGLSKSGWLQVIHAFPKLNDFERNELESLGSLN